MKLRDDAGSLFYTDATEVVELVGASRVPLADPADVLADAIAAELEARCIDPGSIRVVGVSDDCTSPLVQKIPIHCRYVEVKK